ncbi:MAG: hypothetical protein Q9220_006975 [cf. Caloplaca sp. 1 TL-2023]
MEASIKSTNQLLVKDDTVDGDSSKNEVDVFVKALADIRAGLRPSLMAALWMARYGIKTCVIDRREEDVRVGHADGIQCRSLEILDSFDMVDRIWKESCHMAEMCMWNPDSDGLIRRSSRMSNTIPGLSRFPCGVLLAQHRIEKVFLEELQKYPTVHFRRSVVPTSIKLDRNGMVDLDSHPVTVELRQEARQDVDVLSNGVTSHENGSRKRKRNQNGEEAIRAKYVLGCDGAHSWTRKQLGFGMEGEQTDYIWGVLDIIPLTDFPDIRSRCAIHSAESGTIMIIPREDRLVRIYCQLSTMTLDSDGRFDRKSVTPDTILHAAQRILRPYKLDYKHRDWWTVYQIGQRVGDHFSANERIFLAGDAIHTHSPKAGQGMNVSMQDTYNLGWKLALVIKDIANPSILKTYETERRAIAQELIAFDQEYSRLWSSRPITRTTADDDGKGVNSTTEFERYFIQQQLFSSGFGVHYDPGILTAQTASNVTNGSSWDEEGEGFDPVACVSSNQQLATNTILGKRFPSFKVVNHCDARCWHFGQRLKADGKFHIVLFAGDVSQPVQMERVHSFAKEMTLRPRILSSGSPPKRETNGSSSNVNSEPLESDDHAVASLLTLHSAPRQSIEFHDFPPLLRPYDYQLGYDYNRIFVDTDSYYEGHGHAYEGYGVDQTRGCVVVLRPDQHVAWIGEVEDVQGLEGYFDGVLVER